MCFRACSSSVLNVQENNHHLPIICFQRGLFKRLSASSRRLGRMLTSDCCQFSIHVHLSWISSAEQWPQANIPVNFRPSPINSPASFLSNLEALLLHRHALKAEAWGECGSEPQCIWPPSRIGGKGTRRYGSCGWGSSSCLAWPFVS